ncbi:hypothetical protein [Salipiger sp.]|uniref:hypothetical protein n=1 Tax=Salipiger sp. TaxID=2078585 RepID=UPI003A98362F
MADRVKSRDGHSETRDLLDDMPDSGAAQQGRSGGELQRKVGTRDEGKRYDETSSGATRPLGQDKNGSGDKEKV